MSETVLKLIVQGVICLGLTVLAGVVHETDPTLAATIVGAVIGYVTSEAPRIGKEVADGRRARARKQ